MANHTTQFCLLALLVFAAAVHVSADVSKALATVEGLVDKLGSVGKALDNIGGTERRDKGSRSDVTSCWRGTSNTCTYTRQCTTSKCDCCGCPCATLDCWYATIQATYKVAAQTAPLVKTAAQKKAVAKTFCDLAAANGKFSSGVIDLYKQARCPGYTAKIKALAGWQANYNKWCRAFRG